jgi:hypothetical protein
MDLDRGSAMGYGSPGPHRDSRRNWASASPCLGEVPGVRPCGRLGIELDVCDIATRRAWVALPGLADNGPVPHSWGMPPGGLRRRSVCRSPAVFPPVREQPGGWATGRLSGPAAATAQRASGVRDTHVRTRPPRTKGCCESSGRPTLRSLVMFTGRACAVAGTLLGMIFGYAEAQGWTARRPAIAAVQRADALDDASCRFVSKPTKDAAAVDPVVVARNLDCEILANVDGRDRRLRSSRKGACEQGWDLPDKGERLSRRYSDGVVRVDATYRVTDSCFVGDRCEYMDLEATFRISSRGQTIVIAATGRCAW